MELTKKLSLALIVGVLVLSSGCSWFEPNKDPAGLDPIPQPGLEPGFDTGGGEGEWGTPGGMAPGNQDNWVKREDLGFPTIYFAYDQDRIGDSEKVKLEKVANYMQQHNKIGVIIEGHCDERGSEEYNRALGERRAIAVKNYLESLGVAGARCQTISFGEEKPAVKGSDPSSYAKNRRAQLIAAEMR
jgi:peptidoglycan-associated lipoprotein